MVYPGCHDADRGGNVDSRSVAEQINKTWRAEGQNRETPAAGADAGAAPRTTPVSIMTVTVRQDKLSIMGFPVAADSATRWLCSATGVTISAREALFWRNATEP